MNRRRQRADANGATFKLFDNRQQKLAIHLVKTVSVNFHTVQRVVGYRVGNDAVVIDFSVIAHAPQQPVNNARGSARAPGDFMGAAVVNFYFQDAGRTLADGFQIFMRVKIQMEIDSKAPPQWGANQPGAGGRPHQREFRQVELDRTRARALANNKIKREILHRRVKLLFDYRHQAMDLVDKENVAFL